ncbi:phage antirepressor [uncultured Dubosiella sp.]|uniref:phage antirepressor n=1 Tax=uncultured Dubosiella sp. TaxID=1937011 RepID=UPI003522446E
MNELQNFTFDGSTVRTIMINSEPYFVGKDVAEILGYSNPRDAIKKHIDDEDKGVAKCDTLGGSQNQTVINESGLYSLIIGSKLPTAKRFKRWVTSEVLPAIRKHGAYAVDELLDDPDLAIKAFTALKEEREKRKALEAQNAVMIPKAVFADAVTTSDSCILIGDLAKLLRQNGVEIGQRRLFEWLRNNGFLIKRRGADWNSPTQRAMEMGLFEIKETAITHSDGHVTISKTTKVTGKGQVYFVNRFLGEVVE